MFDIGFSEIVVCAIVALVVIGPERMPEAVRTIGLWIGRVKRSLRETRSEIERQIGVDDIRRQLHNEEIMQTLEAARRDMDRVLSETQQSVNAIEHEYKSEPELPYHSHGYPKLADPVTESPASAEAEISAEPVKESAKVTTLADTKPPLDNQASLDKKASL
ncbi:MAG: twin-arginine translocase subunit TatB [Gammaproteobacteria bacterium]|nr:MAG: twin-arginine translocase subunit TatB [Gammaproteobacteria bacterium]